LQLAFWRGANLGRGHLATLEDHQRGDGANPVSPCNTGVFIDIELDDLDLAFQFVGDFLQSRSNHLAGAAPLGPEVDYHRAAGPDHIGPEGGICYFNGGHRCLTPFQGNGNTPACKIVLQSKKTAALRQAVHCTKLVFRKALNQTSSYIS